MWQGNRMQAYVRKPCIPKHDAWLAENKSLIIQKASLGANMSTYKYIDCRHKLCFTAETHLSNSYEFKGHLYGLKFVTFDDIKAKNFAQNRTIDVIGHVTKFFNNKNSFLREAQHQNRRTMEFCDLRGNTIYLTLWDDYLKKLTKYVSENPNEEYLIIVLQFARVKYYGENVYFNNSYGNAVSRLLEVSGQVNVEVNKPVGSSMLLTVKDEFLRKAPFYSISDLCTIIEAKSVIILGTVKTIVSNKEWYYVGCKRCGRKVSSSFVDGVKVYECKIADYNSQGVTAGPRFRIPLRVQDTTGVVSLTFFDRDAKQLFNKTAEEVVSGDAELDVIQPLPDDINVILEKKFAFVIDVTDYNIKNSYDAFGVSKLIDDYDVISELETKLSFGEVSCTPSSEHVTPIHDRVSSFHENDDCPPVIDLKLKRKLDEGYDIEAETGMSPTKSKSGEDAKNTNADEVVTIVMPNN
ncbi:uncharacterized protein LOC143548703 [Bidens hawaiensis]|uniref:uncharacterized protein LOC143548703 n=1 Tax=Bidens hawaiensis TaxID=980011 RepID=UPI00404940F7